MNQSKEQPIKGWVKASERLPEKAGEQNSVAIRSINPEISFTVSGFKNFDEKEPQLYFLLGGRSYLTTKNRMADYGNLWPINELEWLDDTPIQSGEELNNAYIDLKRSLVEHLLDVANIDAPYLSIGGDSYTRRQLAKEVNNESARGVDVLKNLIMLTIDLVSRGKQSLPQSGEERLLELIKFVKNLGYMDGTKPQHEFTPENILHQFNSLLSSEQKVQENKK